MIINYSVVHIIRHGVKTVTNSWLDFSFCHLKHSSDDWSKRKQRFKLRQAYPPRQLSALLCCMGKPADNILTSTKISTNDRKKYNSVMDKFDDYFKVCQNTGTG